MEKKVCTECNLELEAIRFSCRHKKCNPCRAKKNKPDKYGPRRLALVRREDYKIYMKCLNNIRKKRVWHYGYQWEDFVKHMESLFQEGMTWDNWSKDGWHLSHRESALSMIRQGVDLSVVNSLDNLFPQWSQDNMREVRTRVKYVNKNEN